MNNCEDIQSNLSAYHDGELSSGDAELVRGHIGHCESCRQQALAIELMSQMVQQLEEPGPAATPWAAIEAQLVADQRGPDELVQPLKPLASSLRRVLALAATLLLATVVAWGMYRVANQSRFEVPVAADLDHYLDTFRRDPSGAQQLLLTKYQGRPIEAQQAALQLGYPPVSATGLPVEYTVESTNRVEMPCCTCIQTVCKRRDGSTLAIFEHADAKAGEWFGNRPGITANCHGRECCLVDLEDRIAASWERNGRHITLIGIRDLAEMNELVDWLEPNALDATSGRRE